jgi:hypothetical protein
VRVCVTVAVIVLDSVGFALGVTLGDSVDVPVGVASAVGVSLGVSVGAEGAVRSSTRRVKSAALRNPSPLASAFASEHSYCAPNTRAIRAVRSLSVRTPSQFASPGNAPCAPTASMVSNKATVVADAQARNNKASRFIKRTVKTVATRKNICSPQSGVHIGSGLLAFEPSTLCTFPGWVNGFVYAITTCSCPHRCPVLPDVGPVRSLAVRSPVAQSVERSAVNRLVAGSSPARGA